MNTSFSPIAAVLRSLLVWLLLAGVVAAEDVSVGELVFWTPDATAKIGKREVDIRKIPFPATVERIDRDWLWLGKGWVHRGDVLLPEDALEYYNELIDDVPDNPDYLTNRGVIYDQQEEFDKAIADFAEAIRLKPDYSPAYHNRANAWHGKGEFDKAIDDYTAAIRLDPKAVFSYTNRGTSWTKKGDFERAIADYDRAIELAPRDAGAFVSRGIARIDQGEYDKAVSDFTKALKRDSEEVSAYRFRGYAYLAKGEHEKAIRDCTEAIQLEPKYAHTYYDRGAALDAVGKFREAVADFKEAIRLDARLEGAYNDLAWIRATCPDSKYRNGKQAVEAATKACELSAWKNANPVDTLAAALAESGDFAEAVKRQQKAIDLDPEAKDVDERRERLELYRAFKAYHRAAK